MAAKSPEQAYDDWIVSLRRAIQAVSLADVVGGGYAINRTFNLRVVSRSGTPPNTIPLRTSPVEQGLSLRVFLGYSVIPLPGRSSDGLYEVRISGYVYELTDQRQRELISFHWHPDGLSQVRDPHLHIKARPIVYSRNLQEEETSELAIDKSHFPTGPITLQQVIRLLIEDLGVEPRMSNWREILLPADS